MAALLRATDLVAGYDKPALGPLNFELNEGEVLGLWGSNGVGKSTLLKVVSGEARIFSGKLEKSPELSLAYQVQQPVRLDEMPFTGREYLRYAGASREQPPARLDSLLDRRIDRLSGGQFQLLSVWAVLGGEADLVLLDEPTNNLDPAGEKNLAEILRNEQGRRSALLVSHEQSFLRQACSRVVEIGV